MAISNDVKDFLRERIEGFEQLESLLLLWQRREHKWSIDDVARSTKMAHNAVATALAELRAMGLVEEYVEDGATYYRLAAAPPASEDLLERLQRAYQEDTLEVMK